MPPLIKWGQAGFGPCTWRVDSTDTFDAKCGIVGLSPEHGRRDVLAWATVGHETAGHAIFGAD